MSSVPSSAIMIVAGAIIGMLIISLGMAVLSQDREAGTKITSEVDQNYQSMQDAGNSYVIYNGKTVPGYKIKNCITETKGSGITVTVDGTARDATNLDDMSNRENAAYVPDTQQYQCFITYNENGSIGTIAFTKQ